MTGEFAKVLIRGYNSDQEAEQQGEAVATFEAMFNPEEFVVSNAFLYDDQQSHGETGAEQKPKTAQPKEMSFEFLLDGTGANGSMVEVQQQIDQFRTTMGFKRVGGFTSKDQRSPHKLSISWGLFVVRCVLKQMQVKYTLFQADGKPVRATISATFSEYKTMELQAKENPEASDSNFKIQAPQVGGSLDSLAQSTYGGTGSLTDIARSNGLDNIRNLAPNVPLELPTADTLRRQAEQRASSLASQGGSRARQQVPTIGEGLSSLF